MPGREIDWKQTGVVLAYLFAIMPAFLASHKIYEAMLARGVPDSLAHGIGSLLVMAAIFVAARLSWRALGDEWATAGWRDFVRALRCSSRPPWYSN